MASIFTQIIEGKIPGHFVWKDDTAIAFMTIQPIRDGHLLVIPRLEIDHWDDLPTEIMTHLFQVCQKITKGLKKAFPATRVGMIIAGLEVPHTHIHLLPVDNLSDFDFANTHNATSEELAINAEKIRNELTALGYKETICQ